MSRIKHKKIAVFLIGLGIIFLILFVLSLREPAGDITYGASFSKLHADELGIPWKETYLALLDDLKIRHLRLSAHWPMIEPEEGKYHFEEMDFQMNEARRRGATVILGVGKRLPGWPECHIPRWAWGKDAKDHQASIMKYIEAVVIRYRDYPNILYWQVENEPFLQGFARYHCGSLDVDFLESEIAFVKKLDPKHPVMITDSVEFGSWLPAYRRADAFGTTLYVYIWSRLLGPIHYPFPSAYFRIKQSVLELVGKAKPKMIIELAAEPWLAIPISDASLDLQFSRMDIDKFEKIIEFAKKTGFDRQYLWGAEWWYYVKLKGNPVFWDRARSLYY